MPASAGGVHRISPRGRVHPKSLFFFFPSFPAPFSSSVWPVSSLWTLVLLFALPQIPDCPSLLCKHLVKTESPPAASVAANYSLWPLQGHPSHPCRARLLLAAVSLQWETFQLPLVEAKYVQLRDTQKQGYFPQASSAELIVPIQSSSPSMGVLQSFPVTPCVTGHSVHLHTHKPVALEGAGYGAHWLPQVIPEPGGGIPIPGGLCSTEVLCCQPSLSLVAAELDLQGVPFTARRTGCQCHRPARLSPAGTDRAVLQLNVLGSTT